MADIKNQNTLYRFVSIRNPELSKKEQQEIRFVFHPDSKTGKFFDAVKNKLATKTNWEAMQAEAATFVGYTSEAELIKSNPVLFSLSDWLIRNKSTAQPDEILKKVRELDPLKFPITLDAELVLWENFFYQTITQKDFYVKEGVYQMLVLQNLLKQIKKLSVEKEILSIIIELADAQVVLPTQLFEEQNIITATPEAKLSSSGNELAVPSKEILEAQQSALAKLNIVDYRNTISELQKLSSKYQRDRQKSFVDANKAHQAIIRPILKTYQTEYNVLKREKCSTPRDTNYDPKDFCNLPDLEYPVLPELIFEYPKPTELKYLEDNLSKNAFYILSKTTDINKINTLDEAIKILEESSKKEHLIVLTNSSFSKKVMTIGNTAIFVEENVAKSAKDFNFNLCTKWVSSSDISPYMVVRVPDSTYSVISINYTMINYNGTKNIEGHSFSMTRNGNMITLSGLGNCNIYSDNNDQYFSLGFKGEIVFTNNVVMTFEVGKFDFDSTCSFGILKDKVIPNPTQNATTQSNFIPTGFGLRQLGIADYKKVVAEVCCYDAGEVAHIENVMAREIREKVTTKTHKSEITTTETTETETEKLTDSTSTSRFEMQSEIAKMLQEQKSFTAHADVQATYGVVSLDAGAAYASNTSKEESNRQAVTQAKELTQRAMERIVSRVKNEKTVKITDEFVEENKHGFDNTSSSENVSGVFRFINAIYKNQIFNYGKRLMYEFMIPEPSKLHYLGLQESAKNSNSILLDRPVDPRTLSYTDFTEINAGNYQLLASQYGAIVKQYPEVVKYISKTFSGAQANENEIYNNTVDIEIPNGYETKSAKIAMSCLNDNDYSQGHAFGLTVGNLNLCVQGLNYPISQSDLPDYNATFPDYALDLFKEKLSVSYSVLNYLSFNIGVTIKAEISQDAIVNWQKETFESIIQGYEAKLEAYNEQVSQAKNEGIQILDSNPLFYRQIEQLVLKKNCISYLIDDDNPSSKRKFGRNMYNNNPTFINTHINMTQDMDDYGSFAKFMEQAFEWNIMSYNFYPFYWGNNNDWDKLYKYESDDPTFRSFMQAGMARVIVTVKPGFEKAIMHYMALGQIWNGGQMPVLGSPLYLSIVDEIKEQEYVINETWETVVPTNLIALQNSGVAIDASGLPCGDDCKDHAGKGLIENKNTLGVPKPTV
jgi:hypothetical protein